MTTETTAYTPKAPNVSARLPIPRLELRWRDPKPSEGQEGVNYICEYVLVLKRRDKKDIRCDSPKTGRAGVVNVEYILNTTKRTTFGGMWEFGKDYLDTPYREGVHAKWDSPILNLSVYVTYGKYSCPLADARS